MLERMFESTVAVVTGASRGVGKGVAAALGSAGATVYVTGRSSGAATYPAAGGTIEQTAELVTARGGRGIPVRCDHTDDESVRALYEQVRAEHGRVDVLVNNAWGGYAGWHDGRYRDMLAPFWDKPFDIWDSMLHAGVRSHFTASALAVPLMPPGGLIVTVSFLIGSYPRAVDDVPYAVAKAADDRMILSMAAQLRERGITCVALYPGLVVTELIEATPDLDLSTAETPEFTGRAVVALLGDRDRQRLSGAPLVVAELARHYGFTDVDGGVPASRRPEYEREALHPPALG
jgi:NAD(P)-dependent dehydrogenase (short-subunit alcohol dehydrogenase family)